MTGTSARRRSAAPWIATLALACTVLASAVAHATAGGAAASAAAPAPDAAATPNAVVEAFHVALIDMIRRSGEMTFDERVAYLMPVMDESFDLEFMSAKSVGRQWKDLSEVDQRRWQQKFSELTVSNYAGRFVDYSGEMFSTLGEEPAARNTVMVLTRLDVPGDEAVDMNYRLRKGRDGWRIIDIYLKGTVSELALRRSEYSSTLKRDGFEKLASAIDKKIAELREDAEK